MSEPTTDLTITLEGRVDADDPKIDDIMDETVRRLQALGLEVSLVSSQVCNDQNETFRSVLAERDEARAEVERLRADLAGSEAAGADLIAQRRAHDVARTEAEVELNVAQDRIARALPLLPAYRGGDVARARAILKEETPRDT